MWYAVVRMAILECFYTFNMPNIPNHIKYMRFGCRRHRGRQGQQDGVDQEGTWHQDVSHQLKFFQLGHEMLWRWWLTWKLSLLSSCLTTLSTCGLVFDGTVDDKGNKEEKTRVVSNTRMYHFGRNFLQIGHDVLWWWWLTWKFFILSTCLTTLSTCKLVVDGNVDGNDN